MRDLHFTPCFLEKPYASVLVAWGMTRVLVTASVEKRTPSHVPDAEGWVTAEYSLLPGSTDTRASRERGKIGGRTAEIQRLVGRSLRMAADTRCFPGYTIIIDTDVLQADGGTRTAAINGGMLALYLAGKRMLAEGKALSFPVTRWIGAVSAGIVDGEQVIDLDYAMDSRAEADINFVFDEAGSIIEIQGTAEKKPVLPEKFAALFNSAWDETRSIIAKMRGDRRKKMIIILKKEQENALEEVKERLRKGGFSFNVIEGVKYTIVPVLGDFTMSDMSRFKALPGVENVVRVSCPYFLVTKSHKKKTVINIGDGVTIGETFSIIAGPCSIENEASLAHIASFLSTQGVRLLRGGTFKMRSSPYSFQGLGIDGLRILQEVGREYSMKTISEITDIRTLDTFMEHVDIIQVGARSMYNFTLLRELGRMKKPILLKRSPSARLEDFLLSAEYILAEGNEDVILCERGIITFDDTARNTINMAAIPALKQLSHLPVILDPSHGVGIEKYIPPVAEASVVLGGDGVMLEVHPEPQNALSDGFQSIDFHTFSATAAKIRKLSNCMSMP